MSMTAGTVFMKLLVDVFNATIGGAHSIVVQRAFTASTRVTSQSSYHVTTGPTAANTPAKHHAATVRCAAPQASHLAAASGGHGMFDNLYKWFDGRRDGWICSQSMPAT